MSIKKVNNKVNFIQKEHQILDFWKENKIFDKRRKKIKVIPHGVLSMDQLLQTTPWVYIMLGGRTLKDIYNRYKSMKGFELRYQNGFDCQGLWVEVEVEKELGLKPSGKLKSLE